MDDPALDLRAHLKALRGLERINRWTGTPDIFWKSIQEKVRSSSVPLRVLDVATGGGDLPTELWKIARRLGLPIEVEGCDLSPRAVAYAAERAGKIKADIRFFKLDVFQEKIPAGYDIITSSLFLHHLGTETVIDLLRRLDQAAELGVVIYDLERTALNWFLVFLGTRLLSTSPVVHADGPLSVQGAFTVSEVRELCGKAGVENIKITRHFPARFLLTWEKE